MMLEQVALWIRMTPVILLAIVSAPATVLAEAGRLNVMVDLEYLYAENETENDLTGERIDTDTSRFKRKYDIELQKEIYPYLDFRAGGIFELIDTDATTVIRLPGGTDRFDTDFDERSAWLFAELNLENPLYTAAAAYRRRRFEEDLTNFAKTTDHREEYTGIFRWKPVGFPLLDLDYTHFRIWNNDDFLPRDSVLDRFILNSRYNYRDFSYDYTYLRNDADDRIEDLDTLNQIHNGKVNYSTRFFGDRLLMTSGIRLNYQTLDLSGTGDFQRPVITPGAELFLQDDDSVTSWTPDDLTDALAADSIIIGSPIPPSDPASAGLEFDSPTDVDTVYLLPETGDGFADPNEIAGRTFSWEVYVSDDGLDWAPHLVDDAIYDRSENRFEISFPLVETFFIKVVTTPQPSIGGLIEIGTIQAFTTITAAGTEGAKIEDFDQTYNFGLQWEVTDRTTTAYDGFYRRLTSDPFDITRTTLTNSLSLRHLFSPRLFGNARVLRTDGTRTGRRDTVDHSYTASLTADYLDTLRQTLVYSGRHNKGERDTISWNSIFLRTNADLYEGWSADLDLGYSRTNSDEDADTTTTTLRISTDVDPNPRLDFALDYRISYQTKTGRSSSVDHNARFQSFWVPLETLSFFASVSLRHQESQGEGLKVDQDYSVNWAPFPDGLLNLSLAYNYSIDTQDNESRIFSSQIDWQLIRNTLLTVRFNIGTLESDRTTSDVMNVRATLRTYY
jgi:hypothetical protein